MIVTEQRPAAVQLLHLLLILSIKRVDILDCYGPSFDIRGNKFLKHCRLPKCQLLDVTASLMA